MVGTAVSEADCDTSFSSLSSSSSSDNMSSTVSYVNTVTDAALTVSLMTSDASVLNLTHLQLHTTVSASQVLQCRVGVAVAVTFLAGVFQVTFITSFYHAVYCYGKSSVRSSICLSVLSVRDIEVS